MFKSVRVGRIAGIPLRLDVTFLLILPVFAWLIGGQIGQTVGVLNDTFGTTLDPAPLTAGARPWLIGFVATVSLFVCVTLHELGHALVALALGYEIDSITLWLLGGIAKPAEQPRNWGHELLIAVAGPIVNLGLVVVCVVAVLLAPPQNVVTFLLVYLAVLNVGLATFNMLPAFPLDGGRVLRALLARRGSYVRATRQAALVGKVFAVLLGVFGVLTLSFVPVAVALFVYIAATAETRQLLLDAAFDDVAIADVMTPADHLATVEADVPVGSLLDVMLAERHIGYPVLDAGTFVGLVTLEDVQATDEPGGVVEDIMTPADAVRTVTPNTAVLEAFSALNQNEVGRLPVVSADGELVGIVTRTDLLRAVDIVMQQRRLEDEFAAPDLTN